MKGIKSWQEDDDSTDFYLLAKQSLTSSLDAGKAGLLRFGDMWADSGMLSILNYSQ